MALQAKSKLNRLLNMVRWRVTVDQNGVRKRESNARIVEWSDGSTQLLIGKCAFDIQQRDVSGIYGYIYTKEVSLQEDDNTKEETMLECHGGLNDRMTIVPHHVSEEDLVKRIKRGIAVGRREGGLSKEEKGTTALVSHDYDPVKKQETEARVSTIWISDNVCSLKCTLNRCWRQL